MTTMYSQLPASSFDIPIDILLAEVTRGGGRMPDEHLYQFVWNPKTTVAQALHEWWTKRAPERAAERVTLGGSGGWFGSSCAQARRHHERSGIEELPSARSLGTWTAVR